MASAISYVADPLGKPFVQKQGARKRIEALFLHGRVPVLEGAWYASPAMKDQRDLPLTQPPQVHGLLSCYRHCVDIDLGVCVSCGSLRPSNAQLCSAADVSPLDMRMRQQLPALSAAMAPQASTSEKLPAGAAVPLASSASMRRLLAESSALPLGVSVATHRTPP